MRSYGYLRTSDLKMKGLGAQGLTSGGGIEKRIFLWKRTKRRGVGENGLIVERYA